MPSWKPALASRLARLRLRPAREREIIDELAQHLDDRYQELRTGGATHDEAMRLALEEIDDEIGSDDLLAREMRPLRQASMPEPIAAGAPRRGLLGDLWQDLRYAARMLRKNRGFAAAAVRRWRSGSGPIPPSSRWSMRCCCAPCPWRSPSVSSSSTPWRPAGVAGAPSRIRNSSIFASTPLRLPRCSPTPAPN